MVAADKGLHLQHISMCPNHEVEGHLPLVLVVLLTPAICQAIGYAASASSPSEAIGELDDQQVDYDNRFHFKSSFCAAVGSQIPASLLGGSGAPVRTQTW
jgi:hypothetical protein